MRKLICPFCQLEFKSWKKEGLDITCKECTDFHNKNYKKALQRIVDLRKSFENVDEWIEAEAFEKAEEIAKEALKHDKV